MLPPPDLPVRKHRPFGKTGLRTVILIPKSLNKQLSRADQMVSRVNSGTAMLCSGHGQFAAARRGVAWGHRPNILFQVTGCAGRELAGLQVV